MKWDPAQIAPVTKKSIRKPVISILFCFYTLLFFTFPTTIFAEEKIQPEKEQIIAWKFLKIGIPQMLKMPEIPAFPIISLDWNFEFAFLPKFKFEKKDLADAFSPAIKKETGKPIVVTPPVDDYKLLSNADFEGFSKTNEAVLGIKTEPVSAEPQNSDNNDLSLLAASVSLPEPVAPPVQPEPPFWEKFISYLPKPSSIYTMIFDSELMVSEDVQFDKDLKLKGSMILSDEGYINFGKIKGYEGYGFRNSDGHIKVKNEDGTWRDIGDASKILGKKIEDADIAEDRILIYRNDRWEFTSMAGAYIVDLGTNTTGNYVATISDAGNGFFTITGSGTETANVLLDITDDSLDFTEFKDSMSLDASTDIAVDGSKVFSITNTGSGHSFLVNDEAADTTPFVITSSGRVGIGTTDPGFALDLYKLSDGYNDPAMRIIKDGSGTDAGPNITALFQNTTDIVGGSDYQNEVHLRLQAGTTTDHRRYINFAGYDGEDDWLTGSNANNTWILYDANTPVHRFWFENSISGTGDSYINSAGTGSLIVNGLDDGTDNAGTGGLIIRDGGSSPATIFDFDGSGTFAVGQSVSATRYMGYIYGTKTESSGASVGGLFLQPTYNPSSASSTVMIGISSNPITAGSFNASQLEGVRSIATHAATSGLTTLVGGYFVGQNIAAQTVTNAYAGQFQIQNTNAGGSIGSGYGVYVPAPVNSGSITNYYGMRILDASASSFTAGIRSGITSGSGKYNLYLDGTASSYIAGNVGIGTTAPTSMFSVGSSSQFQVNSSGAIAAATGITSSGTINFSGLTASSGVYTDASKNLTSTPPTSGTLGYWGRSGTTLSPATSGDNILTTGNLNIGNGTPTLTQDGEDAYIEGTFEVDGVSTFASNVGIGTTDPAFKFDVLGNARISNTGNATSFYIGDTTTSNKTYALLATSADTGGYFSIQPVSATATWGNTVLNASGGNVGIGTTNPSTFALQVAGSVGPNANDTYDLGSDALRWRDLYLGGDTLHIGTSTSDEYTLGYNTTSNYLGFNVNGSGAEEIVFDSNGRIGVGTTAPSYSLQVVSPSVDAYSMYIQQDNANMLLGIENSTAFSSSNLAGFDFRLKTSTSTRTSSRIQSGFSDTTDATRTSFIAFSNANSGTFAEVMRITGASVGIGTTAPGKLLDLVTTSASDGLRLVRTSLTKFYAQGDGTVVWGNSADAGKLSWDTAIAQIYGQSGQDLSLGSNGTANQLYIKSGGNVGIGTTAPDKLLTLSKTNDVAELKLFRDDTTIAASDVLGSLLFTSNDAGTSLITAASIKAVAELDHGAAVTNTGLRFYTSSAGSPDQVRMTINSSGYVGIGTTAPQATLDIVHSNNAAGGIRLQDNLTDATLKVGRLKYAHYTNAEEPITGLLMTSSGATNQISLGGGSGAENAATVLSFYTAANNTTLTGTERMTINSSGYVGVGTTAPTSLIEVSSQNDAAIRIASNLSTSGGARDSQLIFRNSTTDRISIGYDVSSSSLHFAANGIAAITQNDASVGAGMTFTSVGDLGIGTTTPAGKLDVTSISNTVASLSLTNNTATTIGNGANTLGVLDLQSTSLTTGNFMNIELNALSSGKGINLTSTSTALSSGNLVNLYWNPGSSATSTGDLFKIDVGANALTSGNLFAIYNNGSELFSIDTAKITSALPHEFTAAGDVSMAYDLVMGNQTASQISSLGPLSIISGESFENNDLVLKAYGTGAVIVESSGLSLYSGENLTLDSDDSADSYFEHNNGSNYVSVFTDGLEVVRFMADGSVDGNTTFDANQFDIAEYYPTTDSTVEAGDVVAYSFNSDSVSDSEGFSSYLVEKSEPSKNIGQVLGIVSTKPGFSMGGGSFRSEFCSLVASDITGEIEARETLFKKEIRESLLDGEFTIEELEGIDLKDEANTNIIAAQITKLYNDYLEKKDILAPQTRLDTIEDRIDTCKAMKQVPIALAGRVPVKIDNNNGEIKAGDLLTPSTYAIGKAMKATSEGWVIGRALESSTEGKTTVMAYVFTSWYDGENGSVLGSSTAVSSSPLTLSSDLERILRVSKSSDGRDLLGVSGSLSVTGNVTGSSLIATDKISTGLLTLNSVDNSINALGSKLSFQNVSGALAVDFFKGALTISPDGSLTSAGTIAAKEYKVLGENTQNSNSTLGDGKILKGEKEIIIENSFVKDNSKIFITPTTGTGRQPLVVTTKTNGSFKVKIDDAVDFDIKFDYWIVQSE